VKGSGKTPVPVVERSRNHNSFVLHRWLSVVETNWNRIKGFKDGQDTLSRLRADRWLSEVETTSEF